jgi:hypothetical protein
LSNYRRRTLVNRNGAIACDGYLGLSIRTVSKDVRHDEVFRHFHIVVEPNRQLPSGLSATFVRRR